MAARQRCILIHLAARCNWHETARLWTSTERSGAMPAKGDVTVVFGPGIRQTLNLGTHFTRHLEPFHTSSATQFNTSLIGSLPLNSDQLLLHQLRAGSLPLLLQTGEITDENGRGIQVERSQCKHNRAPSH